MTRTLRLLAVVALASVAGAGCGNEPVEPECVTAADCEGTVNACQTKTCIANKCGISPKAKDTVISAQTEGDCKQAICDGTGRITTRNASDDVNDDGNPCTEDVCVDGTPMHNPRDVGAECGDGFVCDANATCVATTCGNGTLDPGEICDGAELGGEDCVSQGYASGTLECTDACTFNLNGCVPAEDCGNGNIDADEQCDGQNLNDETCVSQGYGSGVLACANNCRFDTSGCVPAAECGNDTREGAEVCDGTDLDGEDCVSQGYALGTLACAADCTGFDFTGCVPPEDCGNDVIDEGEDCDGQELGGETCVSQGYDRGDLACTGACRFDTSGCVNDPECGNNVRETGETCDGTDLGTETCVTQGFDSGNLACAADCLSFVTTACVNDPECGNNVVEGTETCDGTDLDGQDCVSQGYASGTLACATDCTAFDFTNCVPVQSCGNGTIDDGEVCDGADVGTETCETQGYASGTLGCAGNCLAFDFTNCVPVDPCGNGTIDAGEMCDGANVGTETCESQGYASGTLGCAADCLAFDFTNCVPVDPCGNGTIDAGEMCDGANVGTETCESQGYASGTLGCAADCLAFDFTNCVPVDPCGNGTIDAGEICDGANVGTETCESQGYASGTLGCAADCLAFDFTNCVAVDNCGNGTLDAGEVCDGANLNGQTCQTMGGGFIGGVLSCANCTAFDTSACFAAPICPDGQTLRTYAATGLPLPIPGGPSLDVTFNPTEDEVVLSVAVLFGANHPYVGDLDVSLRSPAATTVNLSMGNGSSGDNYVDTLFTDAATTSITAGSAPFTGLFRPEQPLSGFVNTGLAGTWTLVVDDTWPSSDDGELTRAELFFCSAPADVCGNGTIGVGEQCDGAELGGATCESLGFDTGTLACNPTTCAFDTSGCTVCGNGTVEAGEACDGANLGGQTCLTAGAFIGGTLACAADCLSLSTDGCFAAPACPDGQTLRTYVATGLPLPIPGGPSLDVTFNPTEDEVVLSVAVLFGANHPYVGDLDISLRSPAATTVNLSMGNGSGGDNYVDTLFTDAATTSITAGTAPFTGLFQPEQPLSGFANTRLAGTWTLVVDDTYPSLDFGDLTRAELYFCTSPADVCGNGTIGLGEQCDGAELGGETCESLGFDAGTLACNPTTCAFDTSGCTMNPVCGNGSIETGEACDGANLGGQTCLAGAFIGGVLSCASDCLSLSTAGCIAAPTCPAGQTLRTYAASGLPMAIPDTSGAPAIEIDFPIAETDAVTSVAVMFSATHTYDGDLAISLRSPGGTTVDLSSGNGGGGDNYIDTFFTDDASTAITSGTAPFTGAFRPEVALSNLAVGVITGTWTLLVDDTATPDSGQVTRAELYFCTAPTDTCGNGTIGLGEICDGLAVGTSTCREFGFGGGVLGCAADCRAFDTSACTLCADGQTQRDYVATGLPIDIPDGSADALLLPFDITDAGVVKSLTVTFGAIHPYDADLDISLRSPGDSVTVDLSSDNGSSGDNYIDTVFSDLATTPITSGAAPFTGQYRPEQPLARFFNLLLPGTWTLVVDDDSSSNVGQVTRAELHFCTVPEDTCGNGTAGGAELCDGPDLGGLTCADFGFRGGTLACGADCMSAITTGCSICAAGETQHVYVASGLPLDIGDGPNEGPVSLSFSIDDPGVIANAAVLFGANHPADGDLDILLASPSGALVDLSTDNGSTNDNFVDTFFIDSAATAITAGTAPYTGWFRPESPLSVLNDTVMAGNWVVSVDDDTANNVGQVTRLELHFCTVPADECGNSAVGLGEVCDGANLGGATCETLGFVGGTLACAADCRSLDTSGCTMCQPGEVEHRYTPAIGLPVAIPDGSAPVLNVPFVITDTGTILSITVAFTASHTFDSDLDISLQAPSGDSVDLCSDNGSSGDNFVNTVLTDSAATAINGTGVTAPFTGRYRPEVALSGLYGSTLDGTWTLVFDDDAAGDAGFVHKAELFFCVSP